MDAALRNPRRASASQTLRELLGKDSALDSSLPFPVNPSCKCRQVLARVCDSSQTWRTRKLRCEPCSTDKRRCQAYKHAQRQAYKQVPAQGVPGGLEARRASGEDQTRSRQVPLRRSCSLNPCCTFGVASTQAQGLRALAKGCRNCRTLERPCFNAFPHPKACRQTDAQGLAYSNAQGRRKELAGMIAVEPTHSNAQGLAYSNVQELAGMNGRHLQA